MAVYLCEERIVRFPTYALELLPSPKDGDPPHLKFMEKIEEKSSSDILKRMCDVILFILIDLCVRLCHHAVYSGCKWEIVCRLRRESV
jgi:hypothetical protein